MNYRIEEVVTKPPQVSFEADTVEQALERFRKYRETYPGTGLHPCIRRLVRVDQEEVVTEIDRSS